MTTPVLDVARLSVTFPPRDGLGAVIAVSDVTMSIAPGETLGLVGASGSGKSTLARAILGLIPASTGCVKLFGHTVHGASDADLRRLRSNAQMVFQDHGDALNPRRTIGASIAEPMTNQGMSSNESARTVAALLSVVGLDASLASRFPAEVSGGQRQRIGIARALALDPSLIIWDEAVSALDPPVRAQVLNLILTLQRQRGLSSLFISHDLAVVRHVADRIAVLHQGRIVEIAARDRLFSAPRHEETKRLLQAFP